MFYLAEDSVHPTNLVEVDGIVFQVSAGGGDHFQGI